MSHVIDAELTFTDLDALEHCAPEIGLELVRGQTSFNWFGRWVNDYHAPQSAVAHGRDPKLFGKCAHALRLRDARPGDYEIGLAARADGKGFDAVYDSWGPGHRLEQAAGRNLDKLAQVYGAEVAVRKLRKKGFKQTTRVVNAQGELEVLMRRG